MLDGGSGGRPATDSNGVKTSGCRVGELEEDAASEVERLHERRCASSLAPSRSDSRLTNCAARSATRVSNRNRSSVPPEADRQPRSSIAHRSRRVVHREHGASPARVRAAYTGERYALPFSSGGFVGSYRASQASAFALTACFESNSNAR
jgi:hypothetical protein